jgi:EAL domain-containing protein (putative c-di-GMP-specific phosphodiesterase class I)
VLDTACVQLKAWQHNPLTQNLLLAVNVSAKQFHQDNFVEQVLTTIVHHDIKPIRLKLELIESIVVSNINDIISKMNVLSKIGVHFSLDDFGTSYSSLQYLKNCHSIN